MTESPLTSLPSDLAVKYERLPEVLEPWKLISSERSAKSSKWPPSSTALDYDAS